MYFADVITGEYVQGERGMQDTPLKPDLPNMPYESVVDDIKSPRIFVIFRDALSYPTYLVQYRISDHCYSNSFTLNDEPF